MRTQHATATSPPALHGHLMRELRRRTIDLLTALDAARPDADEEAVHALRLAARHLQAVVRLLNAIHPKDRHDRLLKRTLRRILHASGGLRDAQVQLGRFTGPSSSSLLEQRSREALERSRKQERKVFLTMTKRIDRSSLIAHAAREMPPATDAQVDAAIRRALRSQRSKVHARIRSVDPSRPEGLHRVRIALKRYRAMLQLTITGHDRHAAQHLLRTKALLDRLGAWHDLQVQRVHLEQLGGTVSLRMAKALGDRTTILTRRLRLLERALAVQLTNWAKADAHRAQGPHAARITPRSKRRSPPQRRRNMSGRARKPTA